VSGRRGSAPGSRRARSLALVLAGAGGLTPAPAAAEPTVEHRLETGAEYDTNVLRLEVPDDVQAGLPGAGLVRAGWRTRLAARLGRGDALVGHVVAGGKKFLSSAGADEDVGIVSANLRYDRALTERRSIVSARASYYDAFGPPRAQRNFRNADAELALTLVGPDGHRLSAHLGARRFTYKSDADFDWGGPHAGVGYATTVWRAETDADSASSIDIAVDYRVERRSYAGLAFANGCPAGAEPEPTCLVPTALARADLHHRASAELAYTGDRVYALRYETQVTDSNSVGQSAIRHRLELSLTAELPGEIFATVRGALLYNVFLDSLLIARDVSAQSFVSIDDENRNTFIVHVARDVGPRWTVEAQYALYTNEFATQELDYRRQTFYAGLTLSL
jgi:hypothetical protein